MGLVARIDALWAISCEEINVELFNVSLFAEIVTETFPQLLLQSVNAYFLGELSGIAVLSLTMSVIMTLNGVYQVVYYKYFLGYRLTEAPSELAPLIPYLRPRQSVVEAETNSKFDPKSASMTDLKRRVRHLEEHRECLKVRKKNLTDAVESKNPGRSDTRESAL